MKFPRWVVVILLTASGLAVFISLGYWWVTLPERTMREFKSLIAAGKIREANSMISSPKDALPGTELVFGGTFFQQFESVLELERPSFVELIVAERKCRRTFRNGQISVYVSRSKLKARTDTGQWLLFFVFEGQGVSVGSAGGMTGLPP